jgi:RimJ/RimL family protein N-acetyltransferase
MKGKMMELKGTNIDLRLYKESDLNLMAYFFTHENEWMEHDAPWEKDDPFDSEKYIENKITRLYSDNLLELMMKRLEIFSKGGVHLGWVSSYKVNDQFEFDPTGKNLGIGIVIVYDVFRSKGLGFEAMNLYIDFIKKTYHSNLIIQTWSGNIKMMKLAEKLGFELIQRVKDLRVVNNQKYDALTYIYYQNENNNYNA